jgi:hypothetical protein
MNLGVFCLLVFGSLCLFMLPILLNLRSDRWLFNYNLFVHFTISTDFFLDMNEFFFNLFFYFIIIFLFFLCIMRSIFNLFVFSLLFQLLLFLSLSLGSRFYHIHDVIQLLLNNFCVRLTA